MVRVTEIEPPDFEAVARRALVSVVYRSESEIAELAGELRRLWDHPPGGRVARALGRRLVMDAEAQQILFYPEAADVAAYPRLLGSEGTRRPALLMLYLLHLGKEELGRAFVVAGGLRALVDRFMDADLAVRSQAVDCFVAITDKRFFDWHRGADEDREMHRQMYALLDSPLLASTVANRHHENSKTAYYCLQILAFFVGWVRLFYTRDQQLSLTGQLLAEVKAWSEKEAAAPEERALARRVYDDFVRAGPAEKRGQKIVGQAAKKAPRREEIAKEEKAAGNAAFRAAEFAKAIEHYSKGIAMTPRDPDLWGNRSAAYLARAATHLGTPHAHADFSLALKDCVSSLEIDDAYLKSHFRRVKALLGLKRVDEATEACRASVERFPGYEPLRGLWRGLQSGP